MSRTTNFGRNLLCRNSLYRMDGVKLVGTDKFGNRYFEKVENTQHGALAVEICMVIVFNAVKLDPFWFYQTCSELYCL
jgi:hypothetical protein